MMKTVEAKAIRIALLEDDPLVAKLLTTTFAQAGWECEHFTTIAGFSAALRGRPFDLLMLDWCLPDGESDTVIRLAREQLALTTPILIESVHDDEEKIVYALEAGADDYVVKPLRIAEVKARVLALLRRHQDVQKLPQQFGPFAVDDANHDVMLNGEPIGLKGLEFDLAKYFLQHPDALLSRDQLLSKVWGRNGKLNTRTVDTHISRLRKKLRLGPETQMRITTLRGYGYRLESQA